MSFVIATPAWAHMQARTLPVGMAMTGPAVAMPVAEEHGWTANGATGALPVQFVCAPVAQVPDAKGVFLPMLHRTKTPQAAAGLDPKSHSSPATSNASPTDDSTNKGAISQLQEFVQGAKIFPLPPNCPVLQWDYDTKMVGTSLEFRATVAFLLDGVTHHTVGVWRPSKKLAQRDASERTLGLFVSRWASLITLDELTGSTEVEPLPPADSKVDLLEKFCKRLSLDREAEPVSMSHRWDGGTCQAFVEIQLLDVPHTFAGVAKPTQDAAYEDVARRVLWYLQCPGYEDCFEPDTKYVKAVAQDIPKPAFCWCKDENEGEEKNLAERKTTIMRVQNKLQQAYARQLEAGKSVWYWSYECDNKDKSWPGLFRASAHVPLADRVFTGTWQQGQREAQINTCGLISKFLDEEISKAKA